MNNYCNIIKRMIAVLVIALLGTGSATADMYYLDATGGNDTLNNGTESSPWKTLAKVASVLKAGDTVHLKRGEVWKERLTIPVSGQPGSPITFTAYGEGPKPVIHGGRPFPGTWSGPVNGVYTITVPAQPCCAVYFVIENNQMIPHATSPACEDGRWYVENFYTIYYRPESGTPEENNVEMMSTYTGFQLDGKSHIVISDLTFSKIYRGIYGRLPNGTTEPVHDITISNSDFLYNRHGVIFIATQGQENYNLTITGNTFRNNMESVAVYSNNGVETNRNLTITDNLIVDGGVTVGPELWSEFNTGDQEGIGLQNASYSVISRNRVINGAGLTSGIGMWVNNNSRGQYNEFSYNYIENNYGSGLVPGGQGPNTGGHVIAYNVVINAGMGPSTEIWSEVWGGLRLNATQNPASSIYNNVLVGSDTNIYLGGGSSNYVIENNISYAPVNHHITNHPNIFLPNVLNYNLYFPNPADGFRIGNDQNGNVIPIRYYDLDGWISVTSQDTPHSFVADPAFVNTQSPYDLRLTANSPAIDAGVAVGLNADHDGKPVLGAADIGAYEFGARSNGESTAAGTVTGDFTATFVSDNTYESIREILFDLPGNGLDYSYFEHSWVFDVSGGGNLTFAVEAHHDANTESDDFVLAYSTDGVAYTDMFAITKTSDDDSMQNYVLPPGLNGPLYIRVRDTDHTKKRTALDALHIDQMYVQSQ
jgi:hypothetical protein